MFSRELRRPPEEQVAGLTLAQVGLGQSRGYLAVREVPDGSVQKRWCVLREDKLWLFESPDSLKIGTYIPLEKAVISDGARNRSGTTDQLNTFEVQTARGRVYSLQAKSSGDANMWIRACRQHTAKETENQIMDKAERIILEARKTRQEQIMLVERGQRQHGSIHLYAPEEPVVRDIYVAGVKGPDGLVILDKL